jgi:hypothetical protein
VGKPVICILESKYKYTAVIDGESVTIEVLDTITEVSYIKYKYKYTAVIDGKSVTIEVLDTITEVSYIK